MFSFTQNRYKFYIIAVVLFVFSLLTPFLFRLNFGIDMTGGVQVEYNVVRGDVAALVEKTRNEIIEKTKGTLDATAKDIITDTFIYQVSGSEHFIVEAGIHEEGKNPKDVEAAKTAFVTSLTKNLAAIEGATIEQNKYVNIGASFGAYIKKSGIITLLIAIFAISIYIQYAFRGSIAGMASWPFAVVTGISLFHDVVVAFGLYALTSFFFPEFKIDTFFITAMLTILGYSINDTIVVMDRIRSNLHEGGAKKAKLADIIDDSIHGTLRRSLYTPLTILIVLAALFFLGPTSIQGFTLALIYGTIVGTYSSICIASPLLLDITGKK